MTFEVLSETLGVNIDIIKELNPIYKRNLIPVSKGYSKYPLTHKAVATFVNNSDSIYFSDLQKIYGYGRPIVHRVKKANTLGGRQSISFSTLER